MLKIVIERWYPLFLGLMAGIIYLSIPATRNYRMPASLQTVMQAVGNFAAIMVGFLCTVKSILITIDEKPIIVNLRKAKRYDGIVDYIWAAICYSLLMAITSALGLFIDLTPATGTWSFLHAVGFSVWLFSIVSSFLALFRVMRVFHALLRA